MDTETECRVHTEMECRLQRTVPTVLELTVRPLAKLLVERAHGVASSKDTDSIGSPQMLKIAQRSVKS